MGRHVLFQSIIVLEYMTGKSFSINLSLQSLIIALLFDAVASQIFSYLP